MILTDTKEIKKYTAETPKTFKQVSQGRNYCVDIFRLLGAFAIILIHTPYGKAQTETGMYLRLASRWAVPFFFMVSGYFFQINYTREGDKAFIKSLRNLVLIILVANLIYLPFKAYSDGWSDILSARVFILGTSFHFWFVHSLLIGLIVVWALVSMKKEKWTLPLAILLILLSLLTDAYSSVFKIKYSDEFSRLLLPVPFLIFGYKAAKTQFIQKRLSIKWGVFLVVAGFALQIAEMNVIYKLGGFNPYDQEFLMGTVFFALGMFTLVQKIIVSNEVSVAKFGRKFSLSIYLYHPLVNFILIFHIFNLLPFTGSNFFLWVRPLIIIVVDFFFIFILDKKFPRLFNFINGH